MFHVTCTFRNGQDAGKVRADDRLVWLLLLAGRRRVVANKKFAFKTTSRQFLYSQNSPAK